jgi:hypothetical protein
VRSKEGHCPRPNETFDNERVTDGPQIFILVVVILEVEIQGPSRTRKKKEDLGAATIGLGPEVVGAAREVPMPVAMQCDKQVEERLEQSHQQLFV